MSHQAANGWRNGVGTELRAIYFGGGGSFSLAPLEALVVGGVNVCGIVIPALSANGASPAIWPLPFSGAHVPRQALPMVGGTLDGGVLALARDRGIPVLEVRALGALAVVDALQAYRPDVVCAACFPRRVPNAILDLPPLGCLNVHPSLLPLNRGPAPLFWTFRAGARTTGVTVHIMSGQIDAGDIIEQARIAVPDGVTGEEMERRCAKLGGELLLRAVLGRATGTTIPVPQETRPASYRGWPSERDFGIPIRWSARRAFNFIRGVSNWPRRPAIVVDGERITVHRVGGYEARALLPRPILSDGPDLLVRFSPGVLRLTAWD